MTRQTARWILIPACFFLASANVAFWMAHDLLDAERFGSKVARAVQSDRSSQALATGVIDEVMSDTPLLRELLRSPAEEVVIWLLQRDMLAAAITRSVQGVHRVLTRGEEVQIVIEAQAVKKATTVIASLLRAVLPEGEQTEQIDELVAAAARMKDIQLVDTSRLPNLSGWTGPIPWIWPFALLAAIALGAWVLRSSAERRGTLQDLGFGLVLIAFMLSLFVPAARQAATIGIAEPLGQVLAGEAAAALMRGLLIQNLALLLLGIGTIWLSRSGRGAAFLDVSLAKEPSPTDGSI